MSTKVCYNSLVVGLISFPAFDKTNFELNTFGSFNILTPKYVTNNSVVFVIKEISRLTRYSTCEFCLMV